ncbi:MAG: hypothetical protein JSY10_14080 [Paenibacillus sp.]|nr:hypothetical protein [Paenibacillus sp.]
MLMKAGALRGTKRPAFLGRTERDLGFFSSSFSDFVEVVVVGAGAAAVVAAADVSFGLEPLRGPLVDAFLESLLLGPARRIGLRAVVRGLEEAWTKVGVKGFHWPLLLTLVSTNFSFSASSVALSTIASLCSCFFFFLNFYFVLIFTFLFLKVFIYHFFFFFFFFSMIYKPQFRHIKQQ